MVSNNHPGALPIDSDAEVYSCFLEKGNVLKHQVEDGRGAYLYALEGGTVNANDNIIPTFGATKAIGKLELTIRAEEEFSRFAQSQYLLHISSAKVYFLHHPQKYWVV